MCFMITLLCVLNYLKLFSKSHLSRKISYNPKGEFLNMVKEYTWNVWNSQQIYIFKGRSLYLLRVVVVAQLVEWSLPIPEVCGSNPITSKVFIEYSLLSTVLKRRKRGWEWPIFFKKKFGSFTIRSYFNRDSLREFK